MKRKRKTENSEAEPVAVISGTEEAEGRGNTVMEIVWQTRASPPTKLDYIFRDGRRHVRPYFFEFISHVKKRWVGKKIVELFADEFRGRPYDYYVMAVESGRIQVDGEVVPVSYTVKSNQKISHFVHRHEPPVESCSVCILQEDPDVIAVWKPATIPVHPCGQYRKNTVVGILEAEHNLGPLFPIHRLDRLVSGLLIFARSATKAEFFRKEIEAGVVQKQYIARVIGICPEDEVVVNASISYNPRDGRSSAEDGVSHAKGKAACTKFTRLSTDGIHSIVLCKPVTGRTHQIRVHLEYAGHPIANDDLYLSKNAPYKPGCTLDDPSERKSLNGSDKFLKENFDIDPLCSNCPHLVPKGYGGEEKELWLHCVQYSGTNWLYECPLPDWADIY